MRWRPSSAPFRLRLVRSWLAVFAGFVAPLATTGDARAQSALTIAAVADRAALSIDVTASAIHANGAPLAVALPPELAGRLARARISELVLTSGKKLARIDVPLDERGAQWVALVAPPKRPSEPPSVIFSGHAGAVRGEHGERRAYAVVDERTDRGSRVVVGQIREDVTLCGRPTIVKAHAVDPLTLTLERGASRQNLSIEERARAVPLVATRLDEASAASLRGPRLLRARAASSALDKKLTTLTDGDPETTWSEGKKGSGAGEFVTMASASEVGITWIELGVRPPKAVVPSGTAPRKLFLATNDELFAVTMPEDAWSKPGARYRVRLPRELKTTCLAVVLDESYGRDGAESATTLSEVVAHTAFDGVELDGLVGALAAGSDRARAAAALLSRGGEPAVVAALAGYDKLDDRGRELARQIIDGAACETKAAFYASRIVLRDEKGRARAMGETDGEAIHARDQVRRCGREAAPTLARIFAEGDDATKLAIAAELSLVAPNEAVPVLTLALASAKDETRQGLRQALAQAVTSERADEAVETAFAPAHFAALPELARIDLLRAAGPILARVATARQALLSLATAEAPFRTRYLLLVPAAELAKAGDADAEAFVRGSLRHDADAHIRARAAAVAARVGALAGDVDAAVDDPDPRVRDAALQAAQVLLASEPHATFAPARAARRLGVDPWPFVRVSAARTLGALPADRDVDAKLAAALGDASPDVRGEAVEALGRHRALAQRDAIAKLVRSDRETIDVRAKAVIALGALCDERSLGELTSLARKLASPAGEEDQRLGIAALTALSALRPADLEKRIGALTSDKLPFGVRDAAETALRGPGTCAK